MKIVPKGSKVIAIPWKVPEARWELPGVHQWQFAEAWEKLVRWEPYGKLWWQHLQKTTKEDFPFDEVNSRPWTGGKESGGPQYTFVSLGEDGEFAGFLVLSSELVSEQDAVMQELLRAITDTYPDKPMYDKFSEKYYDKKIIKEYDKFYDKKYFKLPLHKKLP